MEQASQTRQPRPEKVAQVEMLAEKFKNATSVFLTDYSGLSVSEITDLRKQLRESENEYLVVKNTLARLSAREAGHDGIVPFLQGPIALAFSYGDPASPARVLTAFQKNRDKPAIKACLVEGDVLEANSAKEVALWPTRDELLARLVGQMNAPLSGLVMTLSAIPRNLVYVLNAIKNKKESE